MGGVEWWGRGGEKSHILHSVKCFTHSPHRTRRTQQGGRNVKQVGLSMRGFPARSRPETRRPSPLIINGAAGGGTPPRGRGWASAQKWASARLPASHFISCWFSCRFFFGRRQRVTRPFRAQTNGVCPALPLIARARMPNVDARALSR